MVLGAQRPGAVPGEFHVGLVLQSLCKKEARARPIFPHLSLPFHVILCFGSKLIFVVILVVIINLTKLLLWL